MKEFKLNQEILEAANSLIISPKRKTFSFLTGEEKSPFKGSGIQFKEFRHYEFGDDIRHIYWPLTAKVRETMVKVYEEEKRISVMMLVDMSGSSECGYRDRKKYSYAALLTVVGFASLKEGHRFSAMIFSDTIKKFFSSLNSREEILRVSGEIFSNDCYGEKSDIKSCLKFLSERIKNRVMVIIISDFLLLPFEKELCEVSKKHDCLLIHCADKLDLANSLSGIYHVLDPETKNFNLLDVNSKKQRELLTNHMEELKTKLKNLSYRINADYIFLELENAYLKNFTNSFNSRFSKRSYIYRG